MRCTRIFCTRARLDILSFVIEGLIFINLTEFFRCRVLPLGVLVVSSILNSLFVIAGNLESVHVYGLGAERMGLSMISRFWVLARFLSPVSSQSAEAFQRRWQR
jgi:hypothetical protein